LDLILNNKNKQQIFMVALKEIISQSFDEKKLQPKIDDIKKILMDVASTQDDEIRQLVAFC